MTNRIDGGFYYLASKNHAYGEAREGKIDTRRNFQIDARIKIVSGKPATRTITACFGDAKQWLDTILHLPKTVLLL
jgi:hypothetical protein